MLLLVQPFPPQKVSPVRRNRPLAEYEAEKQKKTRKGRSLKKRSFRLKGVILYPLIAAAVLGLIAMANTYQANMLLEEIEVEFAGGEERAFIDAEDVKEIVKIGTERCVIGEKMNELQLVEIEKDLRQSPYVKDAEVFKSMLGVLHMEVELREPVARLINNGGSHLYIDEAGNKFPTSRKFTANVPLIRGDFEEAIVDSFACSTIESAIPVLDFIYQDPFWNAQIAEVVVQQSGELILQPQVGNLKVEFGYPVNIEEKFLNLMDFYRQVLPEVGWDYYRTVSVKYKGQVIGRKR